MSEANLRRLITGLERRMADSWRLYVYGWVLVTCGAAFFVAGVVVALAGWGIRWLA